MYIHWRVITSVVSLLRFDLSLGQQTRDIITPDRMTALHAQCFTQVEMFGILRGLGSRVRNETANVSAGVRKRLAMFNLNLQSLSNHHGLMRTNAQVIRRNFQQSYGIQRHGSSRLCARFGTIGHAARALARFNNDYVLHLHSKVILLDEACKQMCNLMIEDAFTSPLEWYFGHALLNYRNNSPVRLGLKLGDFIVPVNAKSKSRRLTRPVRDCFRIKIAIFGLEVTRLKSRERDTDFQINFLTCIDGAGLVFVGLAQVLHCLVDIRGSNGYEGEKSEKYLGSF